MLNLNDKKGIAVIILLLIIILGSLVFIRGCNNQEFKNDLIPNLPDKIDPNDIENFSQSSNYTNGSDEKSIKQVNYKDNDYESHKISESHILDFDTYYQVEIGDTDFKLPIISEFDSEGNQLDLSITYYFKSLYSVDYTLVNNLSISELGTYRVHYQVTNYYGQTISKDIWIDVIDETAPTIEGFIQEYDESSGLFSYIPVNNGYVTNKGINISFSDNHEVVYANYYKAIYEIVDGTNTIEQESLMNVVDIDLNMDLYLYEDGEYHIRAYDISGNYSEYVVTIDRTNPVIEVIYSIIENNKVLVTISSDEEIREITGFTLSEDKKSLTKIYNINAYENISLSDLAGNSVTVPILVDQILEITVLQNGVSTENRQLNLNDGDISITVNGNSNYEITYSLDGNGNLIYTNGANIVSEGHYEFTIIGDIGIINFLLYISNQTING